MGAKSGAALKFLQWFLRGVEFLCAALILGVYSYFLATLHNHNLRISNDVRAVEGIAGAAVLYTIIGLLLVCCLAGRTATSLIAMVLDLAFAGAFIYVAVANRHGASSCSGYRDTPFGRGQGDRVADGSDGFTVLPSFHTACRLQTACFAVALIAIFFFLFSLLTELALVRHHRKEKRFGPGPGNNYTSGYGSQKGSTAAGAAGGVGLFGRLLGRNKNRQEDEDNVLPAHATPDQLNGANRQSYTADGAGHVGHTDDQLHGTAVDANKYETGYGYPAHHVAGNGGAGYGYANGGGFAQQNGRTTGQHQRYSYEDGTYDRV